MDELEFLHQIAPFTALFDDRIAELEADAVRYVVWPALYVEEGGCE